MAKNVLGLNRGEDVAVVVVELQTCIESRTRVEKGDMFVVSMRDPMGVRVNEAASKRLLEMATRWV